MADGDQLSFFDNTAPAAAAPTRVRRRQPVAAVDAGQRGADEGAARAVEHAEREAPGWQDAAYAALQAFVAQNDGPFLVEDVRRLAIARGVPPPPDDRAWGAVVKRGHRDHLITFVGYQRVRNPQAHKRPASLWQRWGLRTQV